MLRRVFGALSQRRREEDEIAKSHGCYPGAKGGDGLPRPGLVLVAVVALALFGGASASASASASGAGRSELATWRHGVPLAVANPPLDKVCDYPMVALIVDGVLKRGGEFNPAFFDRAASCGTKVIVGLFNSTQDIVGDDGGLDLGTYRQRIGFFRGKINPYVDSGLVVANLVIDEPHDCHDWFPPGAEPPPPTAASPVDLGRYCPTLQQVDQAAAVAKLYWPSLPTMVNTLATYLHDPANEDYTPTSLDLVGFRFSFGKYGGDLDAFIRDSLATLPRGSIKNLEWSIAINHGGAGEVDMTPDEVREVGTTMCATGTGTAMLLYSGAIEHADDPAAMAAAVADVQEACASPTPTR